MKTMRIVMTAALLIASTGILETAAAQSAPEREITNVTGDLYRFREIRHVGMFLVTPDGIIVVDPTNPGLAAWLKDELDSRFGLPVKYVIYSHSHNDHAAGGEVFADTATFIGHENMRANLRKPPADAPLLPRERLWDANGNGRIEYEEGNRYAQMAFDIMSIDQSDSVTRSDIWESRFGNRLLGTIVPPDITFADQMTVTLGGKSVELHYAGLGHTDDTAIVLFPDERTIYVVDALTPDRVPFEDLDGTLMLYLSRYLHLVVDLQLRAPDAAIDEAPEPQRAYGYNGSGTDFGYEEQEQGLPQPVYYRIQENRILRNGELRYYDHPKFGVLARVSRFEEADEPEDGELLGYPLQ